MIKNKQIIKSIKELRPKFEQIEQVALANQEKILNALRNNNVALRHFCGTNGYGYDDNGRDTLNKVFAEAFNAESALVSPNIVSGTHAISLALFGLLRPNDTMLSISGTVYDTLNEVISGNDCGSFQDYSISYKQIDLVNGEFDYPKIVGTCRKLQPKLVYIQRSRGYNWRSALTIDQVSKVTSLVKQYSPNSIVMVDNCYCEFIETLEPTAVDCDVIAGSLIKNPGGGIAPTGGYIAGKTSYIDLISARLTSPSIKNEVGSYMFGYQYFYQGLFLAPHTVMQALKSAILFSDVFGKLGFGVLPKVQDNFSDIICSIELNSPEAMTAFCQAIQHCSPIDSFVTPMPWDMPGYEDQVIMAAGCFVQGSSIELSCDGPMKPPYIVYLQGALTFEHGIIALDNVISELKKTGIVKENV